jgi:hypothetical protein
MAIRLVQNRDSGLVVRSTINQLVNYANNNPGVQVSGSSSITGSLTVSQKMTAGIFMNPQLLNFNVTIPTGYNGLLAGPISNNANITIETSANLTII